MTHPTLLSPERFNDECFCLSLDEAVLRHALEEELGSPGLADLVQSRCPYLFSAQPVFLPQRQQQRMAAIITAVE